MPGASRGPFSVALSTRIRFLQCPYDSRGQRPPSIPVTARQVRMLTQTQDNEEIIARVAALDIGKAELVCCVRVPD